MNSLRHLLVLFLLTFSTQSFSFFDPLPDPDNVKISLLTVDIGSGLEKRYGHTILRVTETRTGEEYLLNWGTFDFNQPYYVPRFLKGLLRYWVSESSFDWTIRYYHEYENRTVVEDSLALSRQQKERLLKILYKKLQPEQIYFWYDFFYNNCSTIPRDVINEALSGQIQKHFEKIPATLKLRDYVRRDLNEWSIVSFFLDIMLNSDVDGKISAWVEMFHPLMLQRYLSELPQYDDNGTPIPETHFLEDHHTVVAGGNYPISPLNFFHCVFGLGLLLLGVLVLLIRQKSPRAHRLLGTTCIVWGIFSGFVGTVLLAGWLFSNHHMLYHNANLLLLWPLDFAFIPLGVSYLREPHLILSKRWRRYITAHLLTLLAFVVAFLFGAFAQDVSNVVYFLSPLAGILFLIMLLN